MVFFYTLTKASKNETRLLTRDMGFNLRIIPGETDMNDFWLDGYSDISMPEEFIDRLIDQRSINYAHLTASLHKRIIINDNEVILTGLAPDELEPSGARKSKMIFAIPRGKTTVGYEVAIIMDVKKGDELSILGETFVCDKVLTETGSNDDIRIYLDLSDMQRLTGMDSQINEIMALNCMCSTKGDNPLDTLRKELGRIVPEAKVVMNSTIATARERQRKMGDKYFDIIIPVLLIASMLWIAIFSLINVNQRNQEIGILRALGFGTIRIAGIFFARAILAGLIGAILGYFLGTWIAEIYGPEIFKVAPGSVKPIVKLLWYAIPLAPVFACISAFIPIMWAISRDTAESLKEE